MVGIEIQGMKEIHEKALHAVEVLAKWNERATHQSLVYLKAEAIMLAPYKTGSLRRSIAAFPELLHTENGVTYGQYGSDLPYANITELGGTIVPKNKKMLAWYDPKNPNAVQTGKSAGWVFAKKVERTKRPYLFPVLVLGIEKVLGNYKDAYAAAMKEIGATE